MKKDVRKLASEIGLNTANKKDSQGLCFIGKVKLPIFLQQFLKPKIGNIIEISSKHDIFKKNENQLSSYKIFKRNG